VAEVVLENVSKTFPPDVRAVVDLNLRVSDGEFVVLVGPSGCGKSTTLRMVAGLEEITSGQIRIGERVVNDVAPKDRDIAMVFQNYALYPHMTVYKNMAFGLKLRGYPKKEIDSRVNTAAVLLGLEGLMARKPKALSGGQRQRVALARAIVRQPQAFLFDEPLSNLDAKLRVQTRAELKQLHHRLETTTIYVTHDQEEAMTLGDRVVVMRDGEVHQCDSPLSVYEFPCNLFVAGFIGTPPMNLINGRIEFKGEAAYFVEGQGGDSGQKFALPRESWPLVRNHRDKEVVFGVRPENLSLENRTRAQENAWAVSVTVVEPLGERMDVYASTRAGTTLVARMDAHRKLAPEESVNLHMDMSRVHLFEPGPTGANLTRNVLHRHVDE
jgi:multiple sugar transport system ATP-binding protein